MEYSEIVAEADREAITMIAEAIMDRLPVKLLKAPAPGMVMVKHVDPLERTPFFLGEAYVTECEVEVDGIRGYGCVLGREEERALCGAILDAVMAGGHPLGCLIAPLLEEEGKRIQTRWRKEEAAAAATRVNFEVR